MKKIRVKYILGSGLSEGTESILYETKKELKASGLSSVIPLFWKYNIIEGVIRNIENKPTIVINSDKYTILSDPAQGP